MSHRIEEHDKQQGVAMAWHGLTEIVPDLSLDNNWLNSWDVEPTDLNVSVSVDGGDVQSIPSGFKILRATDDPSIVIGQPFNPDSYSYLPNKEFLALLRDSTEGIAGVRLVSIGSLRNRDRIFASFETQELGKYEAGGRQFNPYLNFGNGHADKQTPVWTNTSNICTVCNNTFEMNLAKVEEAVASRAVVRHRKHMISRLPELAVVIRQAIQAQENFALAFERMANIGICTADAERAFVGFVVNETYEGKISTRARNIVDRLVYLFRKGDGNKGKTLADAFSAVTDYYTHENASGSKNPWKQFASGQFGVGSARKNEFFLAAAGNELQELIKRGADILKQDRKAS